MTKYITDNIKSNWLASGDRYEFFIFDLDNTLYDEKLYLLPGYKQIASMLSERFEVKTTEIETFLVLHFEAEGRRNLFNKLCTNFNLPERAIDDMLKTLRTVQLPGKIELHEIMKALIMHLRNIGKKIFVITNGNPEQQRNKVKSIDWHGLDEKIVFVFSAEFQPKPHPSAFEYLRAKYGIDPHKTVFFGDGESDLKFAQNCNIDFINAKELLKSNPDNF